MKHQRGGAWRHGRDTPRGSLDRIRPLRSCCGRTISAGLRTSACSPSWTAPGCWTPTAASASRPSAATSSRGCSWSRASGSCCTGPGGGWAGRCGSTRHPSTWPTTSGSTRWPLPATRPSCWRRARSCTGDGWIRPGRCGKPGCCPACHSTRWACSCALHHTIADGVAGVAAFGALLDLAADAPTPVAPPWTPTPIPTAGELLRDNLRRRLQGLGRGLSRLAHPNRQLRRGAPRGPWREFFAEQRAPRTSLNRPIGADRQAGGRPQPPGARQTGRPRPPRQGQRRGPGRRRRWPAPAAGRPRRARREAGAARDGAHLPAPGAAWAGARQPGRVDDGAAAARRARPGASA